MNKRNFNKLIMGLFIICAVLSYQNCASQGGGASPFSISLGSSTSPGPLEISSISLASSSIQVSTAYSAGVTFTGADLLGISCTWSVTSSGVAIGSSLITQANSNNVCVAPLTAPATAGTYTLSVSATNSGGEIVTTSTGFTTQTTAPPPSYTLTISSSSAAAYLNEAVTFTGAALASVSGAYTLVIGEVVGGVQTPISGCSSSLTGTTLNFTCPITFSALGTASLYISLSQGGTAVQDCVTSGTNSAGSCLGTAYSITVQSLPGPTPVPTPRPQPTPCGSTTLNGRVFQSVRCLP